MNDKNKTKEQLLNELLEMRQKIAELKKSEAEHMRLKDDLQESEEKYRKLFEEAMDAIFIADAKTGILIDCNRAASELVGRKKSELLGKHQKILHPSWKIEGEFSNTFKQHLKEKEGQVLSTQIITKDGEIKEVEIKANIIELRGKTILQGIFRDITERKRTEEAIRESEERYRTLFEESREAIYITSRDGKFIDFNQSALDLLGYTTEEMIGLDVLQIYSNPNDRSRFQQEIEQKGSVREYEVKFRKKDGNEINCLLASTVRKGINGTILGYQGIIRDITEIKKVEDQLRHLSLHDPLTGLYNRAYFEEEMHRLESGRFDSVGIIMCDVDGLKLVNDALGHYNGDKLLMATANALRESFREGDVVARVGGDEFAILLPNSDSNTLEIASSRIQEAIEVYNSGNPELPLSISMGFSLSTGTPIIISNLFKEADNNMYREKLHHSLTARSTIVQTLMKALETRDFVTEGHVNRLQKLVAALAQAIGLPEQNTIDLRHLAEFHDIGKVGIPDYIIFKQGSLTPEEVIEMQRHSEIGHRIALCTPDLIPIADLILKHHEWWNGKGYPLGLKGEEIPLECRILSIAEAYEAMTNSRPYHKAISHDEAVAELQKYAGTKFDPDIVVKFIQVLESHKN
jgi:diguanylate cyclase (GGDEF)-like protein/PAS domain S-box-containing protein